MMDRVSEYFIREEFACKCGCGFRAVDVELLLVLVTLRMDLGGSPVTITSGCRCLHHNLEIGGVGGSEHTHGIAADIQVKDKAPSSVYKYLIHKYPQKYGIGLYRRWVHIDVRSERARW